MAKAKSTRARARGRSRRARGKVSQKDLAKYEVVLEKMGMVSDNVSIVSAIAHAIVARQGEEGTVKVAELGDEIAALSRSVRLLRASWEMFYESLMRMK